MTRLSASLLLLLIGAAGQETPTFRSESQVVLLDLVVRDKQGRPVTDLQSGDVDVFEDGSRCEIVSFRLVEAASQLPPTIEAAPLAAEPSPGRGQATPRSGATPARASLVVLVFDQLGIEPARRARQAADEFLSRPFPADTWFAAIKIGQGLRLLQPFTTDATRLPPAVERATRGGDVTRDAPIGAGGGAFDSLTDQALDSLVQELNPPTNRIGSPNVGAVSASLLSEMDIASRTQRGYGSVVPLKALFKGLEAVDGRKTVVYFSEGLYAPDAVQSLFDAAIDQANRSNVTVYSVDAGLGTKSPTETSRQALDLAAGLSETIESSSAKSKQFDLILDGLRGGNVQATMETLSLATGGFLIGNTNDLRPGLERVVGELSSYYEVVYVPPNPAGDGRFHRIETKVARRGVSVQTRSGYFAAPAGSPSLLAHDLPLIAALEAAVPPRDFEHHAAALHFDPRGRERDNLVLIEVPLAGVQLTPDESRTSYRARLSMLALVRDEKGRLVTRLSHDWPLEGPLDQVESTRSGHAIFKRLLRLAPGRYRLETALQDRESGRVSTGRSSFEVPAADAGLALSSLAVLKRAEPASSDMALAADPLRVDSVALVPNLGAPVTEGTREVSFFLRLFPSPALGPVQLSLEVMSGDRVIGRTDPPLPAPDEEGRIAWVGSLPAEGFSPGRYELRVTASQGTHVASERAAFEVVTRSSVKPPTPASVPADVVPTSADPGDARPEAILQAAGHYVLEYERAFRDLVAEESYVQVAGGPSGGRRQVTRSDLVFVSTPGAVPWTSFRDVYEVNGQKVRDREARLEKLFRGGQTGDALAQADAIRAESSRYNIGPAVRNINVPTLALLFLHPRNQARFRFERKGRRSFSGIDAVEIEFAETRQPALVTDGISEDLPAKGRFWIDPFRGTVLRSDVTFRFMPNRATARVAVDYRPERGLPIWVPSEMKEWYGDLPAASIAVFGGSTEGAARYSNYRRFTVTTEEKAAARPE